MPGIMSERVENYLHQILPESDALMQRLEAYADEHDVPIIGPLAGSFLFAIAKLIQAKNVLEGGTAIGYSAIWLARAIAEWNGKITTLEINPKTAEIARKNLKDAGVQNRVEVVVGESLDLFKKLDGPFDLCFIDIDKHQYRTFLDAVLPKMRMGGVILVDNVLWSGKVAEEKRDETTEHVRKFNDYVMKHPQLQSVIVPLRDGILVSIKR
jgi:predicted O-methyltransferase YrrM